MTKLDTPVFILSVYEDDLYSFTMSVREIFVHLSEEGAIAHAKELGLKMFGLCNFPHQQAKVWIRIVSVVG